MNQNSLMNPFLGALLCLGIVAGSPAINAALVDTDQVMPAEPLQDKTTIDQFISRVDVQKKLQELGLGAVITAERISLLSEAEAQALAQRINAVPAGGNFSSLTNNDIIIILLSAILLVLIL